MNHVMEDGHLMLVSDLDDLRRIAIACDERRNLIFDAGAEISLNALWVGEPDGEIHREWAIGRFTNPLEYRAKIIMCSAVQRGDRAHDPSLGAGDDHLCVGDRRADDGIAESQASGEGRLDWRVCGHKESSGGAGGEVR